MRPPKDVIIGKYAVIDTEDNRNKMLTDNPREAVWEANRLPNREPVNICGDREFYRDEKGLWRQRHI